MRGTQANTTNWNEKDADRGLETADGGQPEMRQQAT